MESTNPVAALLIMGILIGAFFIKWGGENKN
jgi:hypothetical protein